MFLFLETRKDVYSSIGSGAFSDDTYVQEIDISLSVFQKNVPVSLYASFIGYTSLQNSLECLHDSTVQLLVHTFEIDQWYSCKKVRYHMRKL